MQYYFVHPASGIARIYIGTPLFLHGNLFSPVRGVHVEQLIMRINLTLTSQEEEVVAQAVEYTTKQGFPGTPTEIVRALMWGTLPKASQSGEASRVSKAPSSKPER